MAGPTALKNTSVPDSLMSELGLGDQLQQQVEDELLKRKKTNAAGQLNPNTAGLSSSISSLLGQTLGVQ